MHDTEANRRDVKERMNKNRLFIAYKFGIIFLSQSMQVMHSTISIRSFFVKATDFTGKRKVEVSEHFYVIKSFIRN